MWNGEVSCFITFCAVLYDAILYYLVVVVAACFFSVLFSIIEMLASAAILKCTDIAYAMPHAPFWNHHIGIPDGIAF